MTIRDLVSAFILADATVGALIGTRLSPDMLPQKTLYPAGVITAIDVVRPPTLRAVASLATARIQVDVYGAPASGVSSRASADAAGAAIRRRLDGYVGLVMDPTTSPATPVKVWVRFDLESGTAVPEINGGLSRHTADYFVDYQTQGGTY